RATNRVPQVRHAVADLLLGRRQLAELAAAGRDAVLAVPGVVRPVADDAGDALHEVEALVPLLLVVHNDRVAAPAGVGVPGGLVPQHRQHPLPALLEQHVVGVGVLVFGLPDRRLVTATKQRGFGVVARLRGVVAAAGLAAGADAVVELRQRLAS